MLHHNLKKPNDKIHVVPYKGATLNPESGIALALSWLCYLSQLSPYLGRLNSTFVLKVTVDFLVDDELSDVADLNLLMIVERAGKAFERESHRLSAEGERPRERRPLSFRNGGESVGRPLEQKDGKSGACLSIFFHLFL